MARIIISAGTYCARVELHRNDMNFDRKSKCCLCVRTPTAGIHKGWQVCLNRSADLSCGVVIHFATADVLRGKPTGLVPVTDSSVAA